jgi:hypothetical protein
MCRSFEYWRKRHYETFLPNSLNGKPQVLTKAWVFWLTRDVGNKVVLEHAIVLLPDHPGREQWRILGAYWCLTSSISLLSNNCIWQVWNLFSVDCNEIGSPQTDTLLELKALTSLLGNILNYIKHLNDGSFGRSCIMLSSQISWYLPSTLLYVDTTYILRSMERQGFLNIVRPSVSITSNLSLDICMFPYYIKCVSSLTSVALQNRGL